MTADAINAYFSAAISGALIASLLFMIGYLWGYVHGLQAKRANQKEDLR